MPTERTPAPALAPAPAPAPAPAHTIATPPHLHDAFSLPPPLSLAPLHLHSNLPVNKPASFTSEPDKLAYAPLEISSVETAKRAQPASSETAAAAANLASARRPLGALGVNANANANVNGNGHAHSPCITATGTGLLVKASLPGSENDNRDHERESARPAKRQRLSPPAGSASTLHSLSSSNANANTEIHSDLSSLPPKLPSHLPAPLSSPPMTTATASSTPRLASAASASSSAPPLSSRPTFASSPAPAPRADAPESFASPAPHSPSHPHIQAHSAEPPSGSYRASASSQTSVQISTPIQTPVQPQAQAQAQVQTHASRPSLSLASTHLPQSHIQPHVALSAPTHLPIVPTLGSAPLSYPPPHSYGLPPPSSPSMLRVHRNTKAKSGTVRPAAPYSRPTIVGGANVDRVDDARRPSARMPALAPTPARTTQSYPSHMPSPSPAPVANRYTSSMHHADAFAARASGYHGLEHSREALEHLGYTSDYRPSYPMLDPAHQQPYMGYATPQSHPYHLQQHPYGHPGSAPGALGYGFESRYPSEDGMRNARTRQSDFEAQRARYADDEGVAVTARGMIIEDGPARTPARRPADISPGALQTPLPRHDSDSTGAGRASRPSTGKSNKGKAKTKAKAKSSTPRNAKGKNRAVPPPVTPFRLDDSSSWWPASSIGRSARKANPVHPLVKAVRAAIMPVEPPSPPFRPDRIRETILSGNLAGISMPCVWDLPSDDPGQVYPRSWRQQDHIMPYNRDGGPKNCQDYAARGLDQAKYHPSLNPLDYYVQPWELEHFEKGGPYPEEAEEMVPGETPSKGKGDREKFCSWQEFILMVAFWIQETPTNRQKQSLARWLGVLTCKATINFQNRRQDYSKRLKKLVEDVTPSAAIASIVDQIGQRPPKGTAGWYDALSDKTRNVKECCIVTRIQPTADQYAVVHAIMSGLVTADEFRAAQPNYRDTDMWTAERQGPASRARLAIRRKMVPVPPMTQQQRDRLRPSSSLDDHMRSPVPLSNLNLPPPACTLPSRSLAPMTFPNYPEFDRFQARAGGHLDEVMADRDVEVKQDEYKRRSRYETPELAPREHVNAKAGPRSSTHRHHDESCSPHANQRLLDMIPTDLPSDDWDENTGVDERFLCYQNNGEDDEWHEYEGGEDSEGKYADEDGIEDADVQAAVYASYSQAQETPVKAGNARVAKPLVSGSRRKRAISPFRRALGTIKQSGNLADARWSATQPTQGRPLLTVNRPVLGRATSHNIITASNRARQLARMPAQIQAQRDEETIANAEALRFWKGEEDSKASSHFYGRDEQERQLYGEQRLHAKSSSQGAAPRYGSPFDLPHGRHHFVRPQMPDSAFRDMPRINSSPDSADYSMPETPQSAGDRRRHEVSVASSSSMPRLVHSQPTDVFKSGSRSRSGERTNVKSPTRPSARYDPYGRAERPAGGQRPGFEVYNDSVHRRQQHGGHGRESTDERMRRAGQEECDAAKMLLDMMGTTRR